MAAVETVHPFTDEDQRVLEDVFQRVAVDLAMIADREVVFDEISGRRQDRKEVGPELIHIAFNLGFHVEGQVLHGCLMLPLPDAIALARFLLMDDEDQVRAWRETIDLDLPTKDALLEIGNFIAGSLDSAARGHWGGAVRVSSEGCQGVKANLAPAFAYQPGAELVIGEARVKVHTFPTRRAILMLPAIGA